MTEETDFIIGIRFTRLGKIYHFTANHERDISIGDTVLVETSRGYQFGNVVQFVEDINELEHRRVKSIIRAANEEDLKAQQKWKAEEAIALEKARECLPRKGQDAVKVVHVEYGYLGESLSVLVTSVGEGKVNLTPIRNRLDNAFPNTKVHCRQIGPRDVAKLYGGIGACGLPERCCSQFMKGFTSISIRMAKAQEISLTPEEITGMCGRLRCCLNYEYEQYREGRRGLPKKGKWVETPDGVGRVTVVLPLRGSVLVNFQGGELQEYFGDQVSPASRPKRTDEPQAHSYNRPSTPTQTPPPEVEEIIPESQLEELNAESVDINSQTKPVQRNRRKSRSSRNNNNKKKRSSGRRRKKSRNTNKNSQNKSSQN